MDFGATTGAYILGAAPEAALHVAEPLLLGHHGRGAVGQRRRRVEAVLREAQCRGGRVGRLLPPQAPLVAAAAALQAAAAGVAVAAPRGALGLGGGRRAARRRAAARAHQPPQRHRHLGAADVVCPNEPEAEALTGLPVGDGDIGDANYVWESLCRMRSALLEANVGEYVNLLVTQQSFELRLR